MLLVRICRYCTAPLGNTTADYDAHMSTCAKAPHHVVDAATARQSRHA
ncbi:hypothetical protein [Micromonospora nigra]|nr:hypothetical protein [Micromonospora nigra]